MKKYVYLVSATVALLMMGCANLGNLAWVDEHGSVIENNIALAAKVGLRYLTSQEDRKDYCSQLWVWSNTFQRLRTGKVITLSELNAALKESAPSWQRDKKYENIVLAVQDGWTMVLKDVGSINIPDKAKKAVEAGKVCDAWLQIFAKAAADVASMEIPPNS